MKTICFYNEKGGVGKSTFSILYASYLKYKYGIKCAVVDYNNRLSQYRNDEINAKEELGILNQVDIENAWPIITADKIAINKMYQESYTKAANAKWFIDTLNKSERYDVVIIDLPGATNGREALELSVMKLVTMWCIIIDRDSQTMRAAMSALRMLKDHNNIDNTIGFITQAQSYVSMKIYEEIAKTFMSVKLRILPDMVSYSERVKNIERNDIIRTTFQYPDWNLESFRGSRDLGIDNLFIDITRELDKRPDINGTRPVDLSFANNLKKEFQERRQLKNTSFPEYEFDWSFFPKSRLNG